MFLLDSNIFLEILLNQNSRTRAEEFITSQNPKALFISQFSLHSIGVILNKRKQLNVYKQFIEEVIDHINVISLNLAGLKELGEIKEKFNLDFDDAYQYLSAKQYGLKIVSFDKDFDKTNITRIQP